jgi:uncharacterized protein YyaL (SSP411 family)
MPTLLRVIVVVGFVACAACGSADDARPIAHPLPGAAPRSAALEARLRDAVERLGPTYRPRTRHRNADGSARYTNRLILERSPYLRQHAHNPVDWYPWGDEAFARAKAEGKLVLLSIGYATCHWCHVMEEESFEDEEIAARLNAEYVAIKVDREERPDVDGTYMQAVLMLTGNGGWPMTVWLTPDREVFFGGTYFPPRDGMRGTRLGLFSLLGQIADAYRTAPQDIAARGRTLTAQLSAAASVDPAPDLPGRAVLDAAFVAYTASFDAAYGGFGRAPKFPMPASLDFLLRYARRTGDATAVDMVRRTLDALAGGGVRDQLGGGFHRYATDRAWRIPHFEKMLYDNAQLVNVYLAGWQTTGDERYATVAREILDDLLRSFRAPGGAFYGAIDADDPAGEGAFYTWTPAEVDAALAGDAAVFAKAFFGVQEDGDLNGRTVLRVARDAAAVARDLGIDGGREPAILGDAVVALRAVRATRPAPLIDTKILAAWNGLAISALARAGAALAEPRYVEAARAAAEFVLGTMRPRGRLQRFYADGVAAPPAFLDDYAFLAAGLVDLYEATFDLRWLAEAEALHRILATEFWDATDGGFFGTSATDGDPGLPRVKPAQDAALPSGNAVAAETLLRLATWRDDEEFRTRAVATLRGLGRALVAAPSGAPRMLGVLEALLDHPREIVIVEPQNGGVTSEPLRGVVRRTFLPNRAFVVAREGKALAAARAAFPFVGEKTAIAGEATAYVCEHGRCLAPTSDPATLVRQLGQVHALPPAAPESD